MPYIVKRKTGTKRVLSSHRLKKRADASATKYNKQWAFTGKPDAVVIKVKK